MSKLTAPGWDIPDNAVLRGGIIEWYDEADRTHWMVDPVTGESMHNGDSQDAPGRIGRGVIRKRRERMSEDKNRLKELLFDLIEHIINKEKEDTVSGTELEIVPLVANCLIALEGEDGTKTGGRDGK